MKVARVDAPTSSYTPVRNSFIRSDVPSAAKTVAQFLMSQVDGWDVSLRPMAKALGLSVNTVRSAIETLEQRGYLRRSEDGYSVSDTPVYQSINAGPVSKTDTDCVKNSHGDVSQIDTHKKTIEKTKKTGDPTDARPQEITQEIWTQIDGAGNFMAIRGIAKWALDNGHERAAIVRSAVGLHLSGKPITRATLDQALKGIFKNLPSAPQSRSAVEAWVNECWSNAATKPITERTGMTYYPPAYPDDLDLLDRDARIAWLAQARKDWIRENKNEIVRRAAMKAVS